MKNLRTILHERFLAAFAALEEPAFSGADPILKRSQDPKFGDFQANCAMGLAKRTKAKPRDVAERIVSALEIDHLCEKPEVAGPGFINLRFRSDTLAGELENIAPDDERLGIGAVTHPETVVVDYSSPNIAKQMHVGHLRSTIIGDVIARVISFQGHHVVRQNHLGDWGLPLAMVAASWTQVPDAQKPTDPAALLAFLESLYRKATKEIEINPEFEKRARQFLFDVQQGTGDARSHWEEIKRASMRSVYDAYGMLDVLLDEGDERGESAYRDSLAETVEELENAGLVTVSEGAKCVFLEGFKTREGNPLPMIVQKADGAYLYATTDLAAIRHRVRELRADRIIYVTDARQKLHFEMLFSTATKAGWLRRDEEDIRAAHVIFGSVLGPDHRPLKTRTGENIKLSELLDEAIRRGTALARQNESDPGRARGHSDAEIDRIGRAVGIGAVKYADLSQNRVSDYLFSWDKLLAMEGNTAPYLMYAYARIRSIYRKGLETGNLDEKTIGSTRIELAHPAERALALHILLLPDALDQVSRELKPNYLTACLYDLATAFMKFYENCPVLRAESESLRDSRLRLCDLTARGLHLGLGLLGIRTVERM